MLFEGFAGVAAGIADERGVGLEAVEQLHETFDVARVYAPATAETADDVRGRGIGGTYIKDGAAGGHDAVGFAGNDGAAGLRKLGDEADMTFGEAGAEFGARTIGLEGHVGDNVSGAVVFEIFAAGAAAGEDEAESRVVPKVGQGGGDGVHIMGKSESTGIMHDKGTFGERPGYNFAAIGPVFGNKDFIFRNSAVN